MTAGVTTVEPAAERFGATATYRLADRLGLAFAWFIGILFCAICGSIIVFLAIQGFHFLHPSMLWTNPRVSATGSLKNTGGFLAPLLGTLLVTAIALVLAVPVGTGIAVWLTEYARPKPLARVVESTVEMLAGTPSIVLALFGLLIFEAPILAFLSQTNQGVVYGKSFLAGGAMLALLALPFVVANVREGLQQIPTHVREASYALGKTKIATIRRILLPATRPSLISGTMLGAGHVIGDTAIIVFLLGDTLNLTPTGSFPVLGLLQGTGSTLTSFVFDNAPTGDLNQPGKAYAAAFVLIVIVVILNVIVDVFGRRARRQWT